MKPRHSIRSLAALRGGLRIGNGLVLLPVVNPPFAPRAGSRFGGLPVPNH